MNDPFPVQWNDPSEADLSWEWEEMHCPRPVPPLAGDYMIAVMDGINYRYEKFGLPVRYRARLINGFVYVGDMLDPHADRADLAQRSKQGRIAQSKVVKRYWEATVTPAVREAVAWIRTVPVDSGSLGQLASAWDELWPRIRRLYALHFMTNAGAYQALDSLIDLYESVARDSGPSDALRLVQGLPNELQQVQRDLWRLAEQLRANPDVAQRIVADPQAARHELPSLPGGPEIQQALDVFLAAHGHLGQSYDDLSLPSWADEPPLVLEEIRKRLMHPEADPEVQRQRLAGEAEALAESIRVRLHDAPQLLAEFDAALALAKDVGPLTESHNYWLDRMLHAHVHRFAVRVGTALVTAGVIADPHDIFFLHAVEVADALRAPRDLRSVVAQRRQEIVRWSTVRPPKYLGTPPALGTPSSRFDGPPPAQTVLDVLRGISASPGVRSGPARVVVSPHEFSRVKPGDVLVCPSSNPSWVPLFGIIAALVTNTGGALSHAAVVAREFGIPAVVGTGEATQRISDGQLVEVDGNAGEVRLR